jgi:hypothetical protein
MFIFLRILSNISINRTNEISKKMRQYRILEFFIRELELEFSVMDNIDKYIKKAKKNKEVPKKFYTETAEKHESSLDKGKISLEVGKISLDKAKKVVIPSLNLNGEKLQPK